MEGALKLAHRATGRDEVRLHAELLPRPHARRAPLIGQAKHRDPYRALLPQADVVPFGDLDAARAAIDDETAAFVVEPIQGEGGVNVPPRRLPARPARGLHRDAARCSSSTRSRPASAARAACSRSSTRA